jgi:excinuclease UvrABC nuclease subunit
MSTWVKYPFSQYFFRLPNTPAVYAIYIEHTLVYVGQTIDLRNRIAAYKFRYGYANQVITPWGDHKDDSGVYIKFSTSRKYGDWAMRELRLIKRLQPQCNVIGTGKQRRARAA